MEGHFHIKEKQQEIDVFLRELSRAPAPSRPEFFLTKLPYSLSLQGLPRKPKSWGIFPILLTAFLPTLLSLFFSSLKQ